MVVSGNSESACYRRYPQRPCRPRSEKTARSDQARSCQERQEVTMSYSRILVACALVLVPSVGHSATVVEAAGATFPYPIYAKWFEAFHRHFPDFEIRYQAIGSEGGVQ